MSFLSLEKYLYGPSEGSRPRQHSGTEIVPASAVAVAEPASSHFELLDSVLGSVGANVLAGEALADLAGELEAMRQSLQAKLDAQALEECAQRFDTLLNTFRKRLQQADEERANDFRNILAALNDAFLHFSTGTERHGTKWKQIETSLRLASRAEDLRTLKQQLSELIAYVNRESKQEQKQATEALDSLETQVRRANDIIAKLGASLATREEAIALLRARTKSASAASTKAYVAMFAVDSIAALRNRHGNAIATGLLEELARKRMQACLPESKTFRWSPESIVAIWESERELSEIVSLVANESKNAFEYRAFVGTRVASFSVPYRTVVSVIQHPIEDTILNLDCFGKGA